MEDKFLPIGTVCTIKGNTNKIMIIGFLSLDYNGNLRVYDYKGCIYPNGLFSNSGIISFNHNDIENIEFVGYKIELHNNLSQNLLGAKVVDTVNNQTNKSNKSKYVFDKNGVIIMDRDFEETKQDNNTNEKTNPFALNYVSNKQSSVENKFKFDKNGVIIEDNSVTIQKNDKPAYEFDSNGLIIADNTIPKKENSQKNNIVEKFKFNNNGIVTEDNSVTTQEKPTYEFNSKGVIVADNLSTKKENIEKLNIEDNKFKFDKNGVIIEDKTNNKNPFESNSKFKFDENGIIISEN